MVVKELIVVIWFAAHDSACAVELLHGEKAAELVREGHFRQRQHAVGAVVDFFAETVRPADEQYEVSWQLHGFPLNEFRQLSRSQLASVFIEEHHAVAVGYFSHKTLSFGVFLSLRVVVFAQFHIGYLYNLERPVERHAFGIGGYCRCYIGIAHAAYAYKFYFQVFRLKVDGEC